MIKIDKTEIEHQLNRADKIAITLNKTINFTTFFTLFKELENILYDLSKFEAYGIYKSGLPSQDLESIKSVKGTAEKALIERFVYAYGNENLFCATPLLDEFMPENQQYIREILSTTDVSSTFKIRKPEIEENIYTFLTLQEIRGYWKEHPIKYHQNYDNAAKPDEYLFYGKILMLSAYEKAAPIRENDNFPCYFSYECHISKPKQLLTSLINEGYISDASVREILFLYTVPNLKSLAERLGCKKTGTKQELINRILPNIGDLSSLKSNSEKYYSLSDKGILFLQENFDYTQFHKNQKFNISLFEYNKQRAIDTSHRFEDVAYNLLIKRIRNRLCKNELLGIQSDFYSLYKLSLVKEDLSHAVFYYIVTLYIASCCIYYVHSLNNDFGIEHHDSYAHIIYSTSVAANMVALQEYYSSDIIDYIFNNELLPPSFLSRDEFKQSIEKMFCTTVFDYEYYNNLILNRLEEYIDTVF